MYTPQSRIDKHCIIQWHAVDKERDQRLFVNSNHGSQHLIPSYLSVSKNSYFTDNYANKFNADSYFLDNRLFHAKSISLDTTDLFLYGHSTIRQTISGKPTRGISIGKHYVSSAKVASFLDKITPTKVKHNDNMRIWLLSCHSGEGYYDYNYVDHLSQKLKNIFGWKNKQLIGFSREVTHHTLGKCRNIAASTKLFANLDLRTIRHEKPYIILL